MASINPYLSFKNTCEQAFEFYRSVFGGEFATVMRMTDIDCGIPVAEESKNLIMHIALPIGKDMLMGSDCPEGFGPPLQVGNNITVAIAPETMEEARRIFDSLSAGGTPMMPFEKAPWGDYFGNFTDKFGINWLVNYSEKASPEPAYA